MVENVFVLLPAYNAGATIESVFARIPEDVKARIRRYVAVNDGSDYRFRPRQRFCQNCIQWHSFAPQKFSSGIINETRNHNSVAREVADAYAHTS